MTMKAFLAHSFQEDDKGVVDRVKQFVESAGLDILTGEKAQNKSVAQKVRNRIVDSDLFVGLFTRHQSLSRPTWIARLLGRGDGQAYTTSSWVVQESGFALGVDKELILLVENGITGFPELQGDMEVVFFDRGSLENSFVRLNQMLEDVKKRMATPGATGVPCPAAEPKDASAERAATVKESLAEGQDRDPLNRVIDALIGSGDFKEAQRIFDQDVAERLDEDERLSWRAWVLRHSHALGDSSAFDKLMELTKEYPKSPVPWEALGERFLEIGEFARAYDCYDHAFERCGLDRDGDRDAAIRYARSKASCLAHAGKYKEARSLLEGLMLHREFNDDRGKVFAALAHVAREIEADEDFLMYGEGALESAPLDTELRFSIAYTYSQTDQNRLALLHYDKLKKTTTHSVGVNNLGVCLKQLKLDGKAIASYFAAAGMNETIALGNLAHSYMDAGFLDDAREEIRRAQEAATAGRVLHGRVATAIERLERITQEESTKERQFLEEAESERSFRSRHAAASVTVASNIGSLAGKWDTPWGIVDVHFDVSTGQIGVEHEYTVEVASWLTGMPFGSFMGSAQPRREVRCVRVHGEVHGLSVRCDVETTTKEPGGSLATSTSHAARAYMIISDALDRIEVMEVVKDLKAEFKKWTKVVAETGN